MVKSPSVPNTPSSNRYAHRNSFINTTAVFILSVQSLIGLKVMKLVEPAPQPVALRVGLDSGYDKAPLPDPTADMETIFRQLDSPKRLSAFLKEHGKSKQPDDALEFLNGYRLSPEEFQKAKYAGPCNNFAEFVCHWGTKHRLNMYLLSMSPSSKSTTSSWHQVAVFYAQGTYHIFDNHVYETYPSIDAYLEEHHLEVLSFGGLTPWKKTQDNTLARFTGQAQWSVESMEESYVPWENVHTHQLAGTQ